MSSVRARSESGRRLRSIGEVIAELRPEFPELTSSKLRFWETEGLVAPTRLPNGYRKYTEEHLKRLRLILTLQRDQYLPLKVIKDKLAAFDAGGDPFADAGSDRTVDVRDDRQEAAEPDGDHGLRRRLAELASSTFDDDAEARTYGREELLKISGLSRAALGEIEDARMIAALPSGRYDEDSAVIASLAASLLKRGLEVRHIKPTRLTVERELGNIDMLMATHRKRRISGAGTDQQGVLDASREIAAGFLALHAAMLRSAVRSSL